jgi:N,N'-diacetyllegionaminate synthase
MGILHELTPESALIIAEVGCNHNGDMGIAAELVAAAARAGADAVKFQTFEPSRMITRSAPKADYQLKATGAAESQYERLERLKLGKDEHHMLRQRCLEHGVRFCSSVFDWRDVDLLLELECAFIKVPSGEITNWPLLKAVGESGRPVVLSTGMANLGEIEWALDVLTRHSGGEIALLHCVSAYPTRMEDANLRALDTLRAAFGHPVGFSDHSVGIELALAAVAMGAVIVEKHITLDRNMEGGDHKASLEPDAFESLVRTVRGLSRALGDGRKRCLDVETNVRDVARKSLVALGPLAAGEELTPANLGCKRPGTGVCCSQYERFLGARVTRGLEMDEFVTWNDISF